MPAVKVAAVQTFPVFGDIERNLDCTGDLVKSTPATLYVLPELFSTGYLFADRDELFSLSEPFRGGRTVEFLAALSAETDSVIVAGFAERDGDRLYNSAAICDCGRAVACYRKIHLFNTEKRIFDAGETAPPGSSPKRCAASPSGARRSLCTVRTSYCPTARRRW